MSSGSGFDSEATRPNSSVPFLSFSPALDLPSVDFLFESDAQALALFPPPSLDAAPLNSTSASPVLLGPHTVVAASARASSSVESLTADDVQTRTARRRRPGGGGSDISSPRAQQHAEARLASQRASQTLGSPRRSPAKPESSPLSFLRRIFSFSDDSNTDASSSSGDRRQSSSDDRRQSSSDDNDGSRTGGSDDESDARRASQRRESPARRRAETQLDRRRSTLAETGSGQQRRTDRQRRTAAESGGDNSALSFFDELEDASTAADYSGDEHEGQKGSSGGGGLFSGLIRRLFGGSDREQQRLMDMFDEGEINDLALRSDSEDDYDSPVAQRRRSGSPAPAQRRASTRRDLHTKLQPTAAAATSGSSSSSSNGTSRSWEKPETVCDGTLQKLNRSRTRWSLRWFGIFPRYPHTLFWFTEEPKGADNSPVGLIRLGAAYVRSCRLASVVMSLSAGLLFEIITPEEVHYLSCSSEDDVATWCAWLAPRTALYAENLAFDDYEQKIVQSEGVATEPLMTTFTRRDSRIRSRHSLAIQTTADEGSQSSLDDSQLAESASSMDDSQLAKSSSSIDSHQLVESNNSQLVESNNSQLVASNNSQLVASNNQLVEPNSQLVESTLSIDNSQLVASTNQLVAPSMNLSSPALASCSVLSESPPAVFAFD